MTLALLVNGVAPADPTQTIAADDRGLQYGDGLFETALLIDGQVRFLDDHLERLFRGCERLGIQAPDRQTLIDEITPDCRPQAHDSSAPIASSPTPNRSSGMARLSTTTIWLTC